MLLIWLVFAPASGVRAEFVAEGVTLTPLTDDGRSIAVSWAYHKDLIAFVRKAAGGTQRQLFIMKADGSGAEAITPVGYPFFAEWSWAGDKLAYEFANSPDRESQSGVYVYDLKTRRTVPVSAPYPLSAMDAEDGPFWSADDRYVAYELEPGPSRTRQVWVAEAESGKSWRVIPGRGQTKQQRWSPTLPPKLSVQVEASAGGYDVATVNPDGTGLALLTDIDAESVRTDNPRWSPTGEWVAFKNDIDMTRTERDRRIEDCWIARPDGSDARNLTRATSPSTERQLDLSNVFWTWDGRWILSIGERFDQQGNDIPTCYMIDSVNGGYRIIMTSYPRKDSTIDYFRGVKVSYDSTKIAFVTKRLTVRNWGPDPEYENPRYILRIYDIKDESSEDILMYDETQDRRQILSYYTRRYIEDICWSPDNRSIVLTQGEILSKEDRISKYDVYRVDLPERLIDESASRQIGPPIGPGKAAGRGVQRPVDPNAPAEQPIAVETGAHGVEAGMVTEIIKPVYMTIEEAASSLPGEYAQYFTQNPARNLLLYKGPPEILVELRRDLELIDTPAPQVLVDFLAVELSDEANRSLGLDWTYAEGHFGFFQPEGRQLAPGGAMDGLYTLTGVGQTFYQGVGRLPREFFIRLNTLMQDGQATILANPRTVAMSGKESVINIRKTLNYFFNEGFDVSGRPIVKKSDISADTEGRITPTLLPNGQIHLQVDAKVGTFTFTKDAGLPELTTRQSTTEVTVEEGETIVIGGLRQQEMSRSTTKIPLLADLPLVGVLFQKEETEVRHSVLTILITPQVMRLDNPIPEWPEVDVEDHDSAPMLDDMPKPNGK